MMGIPAAGKSALAEEYSGRGYQAQTRRAGRLAA